MLGGQIFALTLTFDPYKSFYYCRDCVVCMNSWLNYVVMCIHFYSAVLYFGCAFMIVVIFS